MDRKLMIRWMSKFQILFVLLAIGCYAGIAQNKISDINELIGNTMELSDSSRLLADWSTSKDTLRVIIDSDAANEVDDQYAIALALGFPERIKIEGIVAAHYGLRGGSNGIEKSMKSINEVLQISGTSIRFPVKAGIPPLTFLDYFPPSEGVDLIIEKARQSSREDPLWVIALGPATNVVGALLKDPSITDKVIVLWHGRTKWPQKCLNFNAYNDVKATQLLFDLPVRLILFDTGSGITMPMKESAKRIMTKGKTGKYLHDIRQASPYARQPDKGLFDLGDLAAIVSPNICRYELVHSPWVGHDLIYHFDHINGKIIRIFDIDKDSCFELLEKALDNLE